MTIGIASHASRPNVGDVGPCRVVFHLLEVRRATVRRTWVLRLSDKRTAEKDIGKESIAQAKKRPETEKSLAASVSVLWRCPTLPQPGGCSTIGAAGLSFQVRNGGWAFPRCYDHHKFGVQHAPPLLVCWGVWVDRGLYSGCGTKFLFVVFWLPFTCCVGCCLVLAH